MSAIQGVDHSQRKSWDKAVYEKKAKERELHELQDDEPKRKAVSLFDMKPAQAREKELDLASKVGKFTVITATTPLGQQGGFYCDACDCVIKDSQNYLDHINGKKHQRALGTSLRPERATLAQVKSKLKESRHKKKEDPELDLEERLERLREQEEQRKNEKNRKKKELIERKKDERRQKQPDDLDPELAALGLPTGFGTSKNEGKQ